MFYVNSRCLGIAAKEMPPKLFAVIDLYGQCVQVSIMRATEMRPIMETSLDQVRYYCNVVFFLYCRAKPVKKT